MVRNASDDTRCAALLKTLGKYATDPFVFYTKHLVYHSDYYKSDGSRRFVFVYDSNLRTSTGINSETIVIADHRHRLLDWKEVPRDVGGGLWHHSAAMTYGASGDPIFELTRGGRMFIGQPTTYQLSLESDQIDQIGEVEWHSFGEREAPAASSTGDDQTEQANAKRR